MEILYWNARSLSNLNKFNKFKTLINTHKNGYDVIIITESWYDIKSSKFDIYTLNGYAHEKIQRDEKRGGGVSMYIKKNLLFRVKSSINEAVQRMSIEIMINEKWNKIVAYYRPPSLPNMNEFLNDMEKELDDVIPMMIIGDMNIDLNKRSKHRGEYLSLISSYNASIMNTNVTRQRSGSVIDHVISKGFHDLKEISTIVNDESDHNMLSLKVANKNNLVKKNHQVITREIINYDVINKHFVVDENEFQMKYNPDDQLCYIMSKLKEAINKGTTKKQFKLRKDVEIAPFHNAEILGLMRWKENVMNKIRQLRRKNLPNDHLTNKIKVIESKISKSTAKAVSEYHKKMFEDSDIKKIWRGINKVIGYEAKGGNFKIMKEGVIVEDNEVISATFKDHFQSITESLDVNPTSIKNFNKFNTVERVNKTFFLNPVDNDEINKIIESLNIKKATGNDGISAKVIKAVNEKITPPLVLLINNIFASACYPDNLKEAVIRPIYKHEGDKFDIENYRPIAILPILNKIVESCLLSRLENFMVTNGVTDSNQFAFRKNSGTDLALTELFHNINATLDKKQLFGVIFIDVKKAYDSINHDVLLEKLERYGVRGHGNGLMKSYLTNRHQAVRIEKIISDWYTVDKGIGQGTNLGPLLFSIKMNDFSNLPLQCKSIRYADDVALFFPFSPGNVDKFRAAVVHDVRVIEEYHKINGMSINPTKSKFMIIHQKSQQKEVPFEDIRIDDNKYLKRVECAKYLGMVINESASMKEHIEGIVKKVTPVVGILSKLKWTLPTRILMKIYMAHFQSHIYYGASIYGVTKKELLYGLQKLQNRALKHVFKLPHLTDTNQLYDEFAVSILPVKGIVMNATVNLVNKIDKKMVASNIEFPKIKGNRRSDGKYKAVKFSSDYLKRDITFHGVQIFNNLPKEIKTTNQESFKLKVKKYLLNHKIKLLNLNKFSLLDFPK